MKVCWKSFYCVNNILWADLSTFIIETIPYNLGAIALSYPPRVRVKATVKLSAAFFHDESSITIGGYERAIAPLCFTGVEIRNSKLSGRKN